MKTRFHDRHDRVHYLKMYEVAQRIVRGPSMIADARDYVETVSMADPHQRTYALMWRALLQRPAKPTIAPGRPSAAAKNGRLRTMFSSCSSWRLKPSVTNRSTYSAILVNDPAH